MGSSLPTVEENSLRATADGYEVRIRLSWYRSLPVSCIEKLRLALDGQWVEPDAIRFVVNSHEHRLDDLATLVEEYWFVQDPAILRVRQPDRVAAGETHTIETEIAVRFPYIRIGSGGFLVNTNTCTSTQVANSGRDG
jgi:hypothetical protein